jgi:hypothetical protein
MTLDLFEVPLDSRYSKLRDYLLKLSFLRCVFFEVHW